MYHLYTTVIEFIDDAGDFVQIVEDSRTTQEEADLMAQKILGQDYPGRTAVVYETIGASWYANRPGRVVSFYR